MCIRDSTEPVPAQDGEDESDGVAAILRMHISGNIIDGSVVALSTGYNGLGNSDDIPVVQGDVFSLDCVQNLSLIHIL